MKLLAIIAVIIALYFAIFNQNTFKQGFEFGDDLYAYNRSQGGGDFENYFYTIGGEDTAGLRQVVQIVQIPDTVLPEQYEYYMKPLFSRYKLTEFRDEALTRAGSFDQAGLKFQSFSSPISIDGQTHMAFYLTSVKERRGRRQIVADLASITFQ